MWRSEEHFVKKVLRMIVNDFKGRGIRWMHCVDDDMSRAEYSEMSDNIYL